MKGFCLIFNILIVVNVFSQNWNLIDPQKTYFFKHIDSLYITNTIKVDSVQVSGSDSSYFIHTTIKICDTCTVIPPNAAGGVLYHAYWPEIFGLSPLYSNATKEFIFQDGSIKHTAEISDSWLFNSTLGINATVVDKFETAILGQIDSFKVIELSTLDTILISKNHGVIRYPDFENAGKYFLHVGYHEDLNSVGEYLPNARRTYDFQPGDILCYVTDSYSGGTFEHIHNDIEIKILDVLSHDDTISYSASIIVSGVTSYWGPPEENPWQPYSTIWSDQKTLFIVDDSKISENTFKGVFNPPAYTMNSSTICNYQFYTTMESWGYGSSLLSPAEEVNIYSPIIIDYQMSNYFGYVRRIRPFQLLNDSLGYCSSLNSESFDLRAEGVGKLYSELYDFESMLINKLVGFVIDGDTIGTLFNFPEDIGISTIEKPTLFIYPNPATEEINIPNNLSLISIFSLSGQLILQLENPTQIISISELKSGVYLIMASDEENNQFQQKLIVE